MIRIIIPAYNEAANLPRVFADIAAALRERSYRLYPVNDGSKDNTTAVINELAKHFPVSPLIHEVNQGVAAAFRTGFAAALRDAQDHDVIMLMEGDGTSDPTLLPSMADRVEAGADMVIASRYRPGGAYLNFPTKRLLLSRGANAIFRLLFHIPGVTDYSIFYRAYRVLPLRAYHEHAGTRFIESTTFLANAELLVNMRSYLQRIEEVPLVYDYGKKRGRSGMRIGKNLGSYFVFLARHVFRSSRPRPS